MHRLWPRSTSQATGEVHTTTIRAMTVTPCTFADDTGRTIPSVTEAEMREVDRIAITETGPSLFQMMENAGRSLTLTAIEMLGSSWRVRPIVVLAGTGGNGGGGITAARHLKNHGADVTVVLTAVDRLSAVPAEQLAIYRHAGGRVTGDPPEDAALVVDAIIGYSLSGTPRGRSLELIEWSNAAAAPIVSLDVPSGIDATSGHAAGVVVNAATTLILALPKTGLCAPQAGSLILGDLGIPTEVYTRLEKPAAAQVFDGRYRIPLFRIDTTQKQVC
jgi:NAD(P)H-hydrate epimerase